MEESFRFLMGLATSSWMVRYEMAENLGRKKTFRILSGIKIARIRKGEIFGEISFVTQSQGNIGGACQRSSRHLFTQRLTTATADIVVSSKLATLAMFESKELHKFLDVCLCESSMVSACLSESIAI